jgi:HlyD family secretion protein
MRGSTHRSIGLKHEEIPKIDTIPRDIASELGLYRAGPFSRRRMLVYALLAALAAGAFVLWYAFGPGGTGRGVTYRTDAASLADITVLVTATGTVEPTKRVDISSEISGIIRNVKVDYNSRVRAGDVLAELDTDMLKASLESSRARLAAANARVNEAEATLEERRQDLERKQALADRNVGSRQDLDASIAAFHRAEAALSSARADVAAAEADLKVNETNLARACICSPIDGVVLSRNVDPGQVVAASLQAPILFTIAEDLARMEIHVDVDEADVGKVGDGQEARFTVDAYPDREFEARIRQLRFGSEVIQGVVTYKAVLTASNEDLLLRPGMTATAEIIVQSEKGVLTVSNEALRYSPPVEEQDNRSFLERLIPSRPPFRGPSAAGQTGPERRIWILGEDGEPRAVAVKIGASDGRRTRILEGPLEAGDRLIVEAVAASN